MNSRTRLGVSCTTNEAVVDLLRQVLAELAAQRAALTSIVQLLERGRGARDAADAAVLPALAASIGAAQFTSVQLRAHARVDATLAEALDAADITTVRELGKLLARLETQVMADLRVARVGKSRDGIIWRVVAQV